MGAQHVFCCKNNRVAPWTHYRLVLEEALKFAGNNHVTTLVLPRADHRLEIGFGEDEQGRWQWFGVAPGALTSIEQFSRDSTSRTPRREPRSEKT